jgi:hypothetical protein
MDSYKWEAVTPADAKVFHSVPMKPGNSCIRVADKNPTSEHDWRDGVKVKRERIPSMIIGQEGYGRCRKHKPKGKDVLDILIEREERGSRIPEVVVASHVTVTNCRPMDAPKIRKRKKKK